MRLPSRREAVYRLAAATGLPGRDVGLVLDGDGARIGVESRAFVERTARRMNLPLADLIRRDAGPTREPPAAVVAAADAPDAPRATAPRGRRRYARRLLACLPSTSPTKAP